MDENIEKGVQTKEQQKPDYKVRPIIYLFAILGGFAGLLSVMIQVPFHSRYLE